MAAARSSSSSQIDRAPRVTTRAPSRTPNTGAAGLRVPAPSPARALPASLMNFWASPAALPPRAALIQSLTLISIWTRAGPTADRIAARGRNTKAERMACMPSARTIDWATETSRMGRAMTTARASITRYWEANQSALTTSGLVVPWISPPTFSRKNLPAAATAAVKLRRALSPAGSVGWAWAVAAGASTTSRAARAARTRTARAQPRPRLGSWCIGELLEVVGLVDQLGGRGRGGHVGDRDRAVPGRAGQLLPVAPDPAQVDGGGAPGLADGHGALGAAQGPA